MKSLGWYTVVVVGGGADCGDADVGGCAIGSADGGATDVGGDI